MEELKAKADDEDALLLSSQSRESLITVEESEYEGGALHWRVRVARPYEIVVCESSRMPYFLNSKGEPAENCYCEIPGCKQSELVDIIG